jgi:hypothetical protein
MTIDGPANLMHLAGDFMASSSSAMERAAERMSVGQIEGGTIDMKIAQASMEVATGVTRVADESLASLVSLITG